MQKNIAFGGKILIIYTPSLQIVKFFHQVPGYWSPLAPPRRVDELDGGLWVVGWLFGGVKVNILMAGPGAFTWTIWRVADIAAHQHPHS